MSKDISVPLPLPLHFTLLPTLSPGSSLAPLFYVLINDIPVYLTLCPSYLPHFSLLPLLLSLRPPIPPIHILTSLRLTSKDYSVDIAGTAPFHDIWVNWGTARRICESLNLGRLFWDSSSPSRGLLGKWTKDVLSWDEHSQIGHKQVWIPGTRYISSSSYSLSTLLSTPFNSVSMIPSDKCVCDLFSIFTPIDPGRRVTVIRQGEHEDSSKIRGGSWAKNWEGIARWTMLAWEDFLLFPSKPPKDMFKEAGKDLPSILHGLVPAVASIGDGHPTFSPVLVDLQAVFGVIPSQNSSSMFELISMVFNMIPLPFVKRVPEIPASSFNDLQRRARVQLGIVEAVSMATMSAWRSEHDRKRLEEAVPDRSKAPAIVLRYCHPQYLVEGSAGELGNSGFNTDTTQGGKGKGRSRQRRGSIVDLERKRGASPCDSDSTILNIRSSSSKTRKTPIGLPTSTAAEGDPAMEKDSVRAPSAHLGSPLDHCKEMTGEQVGSPSSSLIKSPSQESTPKATPHVSRSDHVQQAEATSTAISDREERTSWSSDELKLLQRKPRRSNSNELSPLQHNHAQSGLFAQSSLASLGTVQRPGPDFNGVVTGPVIATGTVRNMMKSEDTQGWWMYLSILGSVIVALVLGMW